MPFVFSQRAFFRTEIIFVFIKKADWGYRDLNPDRRVPNAEAYQVST